MRGRPTRARRSRRRPPRSRCRACCAALAHLEGAVERLLVGLPELLRANGAGQGAALAATLAEADVAAAGLLVPPRLHVGDAHLAHCPSLPLRSSAAATSHGLSLVVLSGSPPRSSLVPSGSVMAVTALPVAFSAWAMVRSRRGLR